MRFEFFAEPKDPSENIDYTLPVCLNAGDAIANAVIDTVDPTSTTVVTTDLVLSPATYGAMSGTTHGVTFWVSGGSVGTYFLRFTITTQQGRTFQRTLGFCVEQR